VIYPPQPDSLDGTTLEGRIAVSIQRPEDTAALFGALWVVAELDANGGRDIARVASLRVERTRFAGVAESDIQWLVQAVERDARRWNYSMNLTRLKASLQAAEGGRDTDYRNDPPRIVMVDRPAILLLLDGQPRLVDAGPDAGTPRPTAPTRPDEGTPQPTAPPSGPDRGTPRAPGPRPRPDRATPQPAPPPATPQPRSQRPPAPQRPQRPAQSQGSTRATPRQPRPPIPAEPRAGGSKESERDARIRGERVAPQDGQPNRRQQ